jgi:predicted MFS family arabinose efflux permease
MVSVPLLVTLTDRIDPKHVYLFGVASTVAGHLLFGVLAEGFWSALILRALTGMGWAGTYMTGLKLLADRVDAKMMSRATAGHAASIGISGALSFATGDLIASVAKRTLPPRMGRGSMTFGRCSATARPWPTPSPTASTRWR